ncbi:MAG TPA: IMP cyclohydrolase [Candidatus Paceibacterota bacterium]|nr:IMP cyclohydrolase [Candidatus Paceibacterota bacterium]
MKIPAQLALENFNALAQNPYPGRGLILGMDEEGNNALQVYWIMGRSESSRNRVFGQEFGRLSVELADPSKSTDPKQLELIVYDAMLDDGAYFVVSNGRQTDDVMASRNMDVGLMDYTYESDVPNFTPRITGVFGIHPITGERHYKIVIIRKSSRDDSCERIGYRYQTIGRGFGYCVTTYRGDGNPLPSFHGEPLLMPLRGSPEEILEAYWQALNADNRVALAVKVIPLDQVGRSRILIRNKYEKVAAVTS